MNNTNTPAEGISPPHWIVPGISFKNPELAKTATIVRAVPWMMPNDWQPLSVLSKGYPNKGSESMWETKKLNIRKPYWRRKFKNNQLVRMGHNHVEVPSFTEVGLGQTENMKNPPAPIANRDLWGNLTSLLTTAGSEWQKKEELGLRQKAASQQLRIQAKTDEIEQSRYGSYMTKTNIAKIAGVGLLGYFLLRG